jgi:tRNA (mo5U34)-methyltransferase
VVLEESTLQQQVDSLLWYHSIDLGNGVVTRGLSDPKNAVTVEQLPPFAGRTVLDIGAWDGYYSFLAERCGASRVVALDHYSWGVDFSARDRYWQQCRDDGTLPNHARDATDFWQPDLPGKRGFDLACSCLHSKIEPVVADFTTVDLPSLGTFDVVLYLGVMYHMKEPLECLERVRAVTREVAVIETAAVRGPRNAGHRLLMFHPGSELNRDFGNWYQPNIAALQALVLAAGFSRVEVVQGPPAPRSRWKPGLVWTRLLDRERPVEEYRAIVHAYV